MKFSIITASFSESTIRDTLIPSWNKPIRFWVLVIDEIPLTLYKIVKSYNDNRIKLFSENDLGIYFAMNKGLKK